MVDNVEADVGTGGAFFATDEISTVHYPLNKLGFGVLDSFTIVSAADGLPVELVAGTAEIGNITNSGAFAVQVDGINGTVDANNNSSTPLGIGATFTGTSTDILQFSGITISVFSDVASATDGLSVQFSADGTNWDHLDTFTIPAGTGKTFSFQPVARFMRVLYTNGGTAQADFRLSVILKTATGKSSSHRIADSISDQDDAEVVKAVLTAENPSNQFINVQATAAGNFKVSLEESNGDVTGPGTEDTALKVTLASDSEALQSLQLIDDPVFADDAAFTLASSKTMVAGVIRDDILSILSAAEGDVVPLRVDANGALYTKHPNEISTNNSTTSTLTSASTFTGTGDDVGNFASITVQTDASHDGATDGMTFQFSTDNSNWDDVYLFTYTAADGARRFQFPVTAQYFRVVYTNGGTGQTHFRLQTILHANSGLTSIHRLVDSVDPDRSATLSKSVIIAQAAGSGDFVPVQATAAGNLKMSVQEISDGLDIGAGNAGSETQRVSISTDDVNLSAIKTAIELLDNAVSGAGYNITQMNGVNVTMGNGVSGTGVQRVSIASNSTGQIKLAAGTALAGKMGIDQVTANANKVVTKTGSVTKLEANDGVDIGDVDVASQPARVATTDNVGAAIQTNQMMDGTTSLTPKFAAIDVGASGDNTLVALVSGKKIRVLQVTLIATAAVNVRFESGAAGAALTGQMALTANSGFEASFCPVGLFETASGVLLNLELSSAVPVDGWLVYVEV
jgi:hypothetical protein